MDNAYYSRIAGSLEVCRQKRDDRQNQIASRLARPTMTVAGFGNKGRPMAAFLRDKAGKDVTVYDQSPAGRAAAQEAGFDVHSRPGDVNPLDAVVLAACQQQLVQLREFPSNYVFYEEAGYFFNMPYHFHHVPDFGAWTLDNMSELIEFASMLPALPRVGFESVLRYRVSLDPADLADCRRHVSGMWFDIPAALRRRSYDCFLDVGAYDGDTLDASARWQLGLKRAVALEANHDFAAVLAQRGDLFPSGLDVVECAAWSHPCMLTAVEDAMGMVTVSESEGGSIAAKPLDDVVASSVSFLKMDIEGAEIQALKGARRILADGPDLAIAAYHRPDDLLNIFAAVTEVAGNNRYDFQVAHYSDSLDDTIYYFLNADHC